MPFLRCTKNCQVDVFGLQKSSHFDMLQNVHHERGLNKIFLDVNKCLMHQNSKNIGTNQGYYQLSLMSVFDSSSSVK